MDFRKQESNPESGSIKTRISHPVSNEELMQAVNQLSQKVYSIGEDLKRVNSKEQISQKKTLSENFLKNVMDTSPPLESKQQTDIPKLNSKVPARTKTDQDRKLVPKKLKNSENKMNEKTPTPKVGSKNTPSK